MLQVAYLTNEESMDDTIVYISLLMTILSVILAIVQQMSRIVDLCKPKREKFTHQTDIIGDFKIKSQYLHSYHAFCHSKLEHCFLTLFNLGSDWRKRSDVSYSVEVYHIENEISSSKILIAYFKIKLLSVGSDSELIVSQFQTFIEHAFSKSTKNYALFKTVKQMYTRQNRIHVSCK